MKRKCAIGILLLAVILTVQFSFAYWNTLRDAYDYESLSLNIGSFGDEHENPVALLPDYAPDYLKQQFEDMVTQGYDRDVLEQLIYAVINVIDYSNFDPDHTHVHIAGDLENLFPLDPSLDSVIDRGDIIIYTVFNPDTGQNEFAMIHLSDNSNTNITTLQQLNDALQHPWTGVNAISSVWIRGNQYTTYNAPVEYQYKYYLMRFNGPSGTPPPQDRNTWFEVTPDYEYSAENVYYRGYVVKSGNEFYIATEWAAVSPQASGWSPWNRIPEFSQGNSYFSGAVVYTIDNGQPRFWRALTQTTAEPSEQNASNNIWQEFSNGWIGNGGQSIHSFYYAHNHYKRDEVVIYGVSPLLRYRYFSAKSDVPPGNPPLIDTGSGIEVNDTFWNVH